MTINNEIVNVFLLCEYKSYLRYCQHVGKKTEYEEMENRLVEHCKTEFYKRLRQKYPESQILPRITFAEKLYNPGIVYAIHPRFQGQEYDIWFDAIEVSRQKQSKPLIFYTPIDIMYQERISKVEKLAFTIKCLILSKYWSYLPLFGKIIYGGCLQSCKIRLSTYWKEAETVLLHLTTMLKSGEAPRFYQNKHCSICEFHSECYKKLQETDDLSLLKGMSQKEILKYNNKGIFTVLQCSYTFKPRKKRKVQRREWALKALALREQQTYIQEVPDLPDGVPALYVDFEGLPNEKYIYLIGVVSRNATETQEFSWWADSVEDEARIFHQFFQYVSNIADYRLYHYGSYEVKALTQFDKKSDGAYHKTITHILNKAVNVLAFFAFDVYPPTYSNELKEIAGFLGFTWSRIDASGIQSIVWRKQWELSRESTYKERLILYNLEDCRALMRVTDWLSIIAEKVTDEQNTEFSKVECIKKEGFAKWKKASYDNDDYTRINQLAYFDYQRSKVYLRTSQMIKRAVKDQKKVLNHANTVNKTITILPTTCPACHSSDLRQTICREKFSIDLKFSNGGIKKWVRKFIGGIFQCGQCGTSFLPSQYKQIMRQPSTNYLYGHNLMAWSVYTYLTYRISFEKIEQLLLDSYHIYATRSVIRFFKATMAQTYRVTFEEIREHVLHGSLIHADETPVKVKPFSGGYVWVFASMDAVFYLFKPTREADFLHELFEGFTGVLVSDFYSGYDSLPCAQQKCLIHLIRDLNDDWLTHQLNMELKAIVINFGKMLRTIIETIDRYGLKKVHLQKHNSDVERFYERSIEVEYESEIARKYQKKFRKYRSKLFTFLNYDSVPWNNNNAEHAIKPFAKYRRGLDGQSTENSLNEYLVLLSIQQTCHYRGMNFLEFLRSKEKNMAQYTKQWR
ncbi:MAG: TM0106 family RecB-like putative nuclease [Candidatus Thermoplasmatota archaeon]|nr:TM0106 family RecB-like putative nuclease [Candidatus Thermoplasmatota archaeon]